MNRRDFLRASGALAVSAGAASAGALTAGGGPAILSLPSRTRYGPLADVSPRVGLIGSGWYGKTSLFRLLQVAPAEVVSLCDVDSRMVAEAADLVAQRQESGNRPRTYGDYREMLAERDLDAVLIATPDHWHALTAIAAIEAGADVYVEKPISVDVLEGLAMLEAARAHGAVVQVNTQRRSTPHLIEARDRIVREGLLGKVGFVEMYCYYPRRGREVPAETEPPAHLDYEMWTGPAPLRPFIPIMHPRGWRGFMEYGNGVLGDMCIHMLDMARWMLDVGWPKQISSSGGILIHKHDVSNVPDTQTATFDYGDLQMVWQHRTWGHPRDPDDRWGATFYGDRGTLKASVWGYTFIPEGDGPTIAKEVEYELDEYPEDREEDSLERHVAPALRRHLSNFLEARATRGRPVADIEEGYISSASCILANIALELGRTLTWDPRKNEVVGDAEANRLLQRPYREPWPHPA